jgi:hypothetical protein
MLLHCLKPQVEKVAIQMAIRRAENMAMETLVAVPREEATKLVD